jgi:hypothetical protein
MSDPLTTLQRQILTAVEQGRQLCATTGGFEIHLGQTRTVTGGTVAVATRIKASTIRNMVEKGALRLTTGQADDGRRYPMYVVAAPPGGAVHGASFAQ